MLNSSLPKTYLYLDFLTDLQTQQTPQLRRKGPWHQLLTPGTRPSHLIPPTTWAGYHGVLSSAPHVLPPPWALPTTSPGHLHTGSPSQWSPATGCSPHSSCSYLFKTFFVVHYSPPERFGQAAACRAEQGTSVQRVRELQRPRPESQSEQGEGEPTLGEGKRQWHEGWHQSSSRLRQCPRSGVAWHRLSEPRQNEKGFYLGDSLCKYQNTWWERLAPAHGQEEREGPEWVLEP